MISMIIIGIFLTINIFILYYLNVYRVSEDLRNYKTCLLELKQLIDASIDYYIHFRGLYDVMIGNTLLSKKDYLKIIEDVAHFTSDQIPKMLERRCKKYLSKEQYANFIIFNVEAVVSKIYSPGDIEEMDESGELTSNESSE